LENEIQAQSDIGFNLLWILGSETLLKHAVNNGKAGKPHDVLEIIYKIADKKNMRVIIDLVPSGGDLFNKTTPEKAVAKAKTHINNIHKRYGSHNSFYGWYLNNELNPLHPSEQPVSLFWRKMWKGVVDECHRVVPGSEVTISPFFLLDKERFRGFIYLTPDEYAEWWETTLKETGIDIYMLQDSGEHLAFFTMKQREPFFASVANACHNAGAQFWLNVETGEADVKNWKEYLELERKAHSLGKDKEPSSGIVPWRFTPIDRLAEKLALAARYADNIINWGYYPFMNPYTTAGDSIPGSKQAYEAYKKYYLKTMENNEDNK
ncbi:MAG: DUF4434 domain-containing protein, partial [Victivallaceae bacterium]|nr:DUF4434 domain-containing protein [Victivallaceae bacterium]